MSDQPDTPAALSLG